MGKGSALNEHGSWVKEAALNEHGSWGKELL